MKTSPMTAHPIDLDRVMAESFLADAEHYASIGSTNDRAKEAAASPRKLPLLIVADCQTAGRGRGANRWWTGSGSLAISVLANPATWRLDPRQHGAELSLAAARAVAETVNTRLCGKLQAEVRAPNDVYVGDRKVAGILIEGLACGLLVIGIGMNMNNVLADAPAALRDRVTTLRDLLGRAVDPTELLLELLAHLDAALGSVAESAQHRVCDRRVGPPS